MIPDHAAPNMYRIGACSSIRSTVAAGGKENYMQVPNQMRYQTSRLMVEDIISRFVSGCFVRSTVTNRV